MIDKPRTREEAEAYRYGEWPGNPKGNAYLPARCAFEVSSGWLFAQCARKPGHGPDELYCKQHAKQVRP